MDTISSRAFRISSIISLHLSLRFPSRPFTSRSLAKSGFRCFSHSLLKLSNRVDVSPQIFLQFLNIFSSAREHLQCLLFDDNVFLYRLKSRDAFFQRLLDALSLCSVIFLLSGKVTNAIKIVFYFLFQGIDLFFCIILTPISPSALVASGY